MLYKSLFLFFLVGIGLSRALSEGSECMWGQYKGTCMQSEKCLLMIKDSRLKELPPACDDQGTSSLVCCTECPVHHVANTSHGLINPYGGIAWKTGRKAWDACYDYLESLPYLCKSSYYSGLQLQWNEKTQCHNIGFFGIGGPPAIGDNRSEHPHAALLGYGENMDSAKWLCHGSLISNKYLLTAAHCSNSNKHGSMKYVALGVLQRTDSPSTWQRYTIKRIINHPDFSSSMKYNDIALVETDKVVEFNFNVLPACLPINLADDSSYSSHYTLVWHRKDFKIMPGYLYQVDMDKVSNADCQVQYPSSPSLKEGLNNVTQMCYVEKEYPVQRNHCVGEDGSPLLRNGQLSKCQETLLGLTTRGGACISRGTPLLLTSVEPYVPWIESIVWP